MKAFSLTRKFFGWATRRLGCDTLDFCKWIGAGATLLVTVLTSLLLFGVTVFTSFVVSAIVSVLWIIISLFVEENIEYGFANLPYLAFLPATALIDLIVLPQHLVKLRLHKQKSENERILNRIKLDEVRRLISHGPDLRKIQDDIRPLPRGKITKKHLKELIREFYDDQLGRGIQDVYEVDSLQVCKERSVLKCKIAKDGKRATCIFSLTLKVSEKTQSSSRDAVDTRVFGVHFVFEPVQKVVNLELFGTFKLDRKNFDNQMNVLKKRMSGELPISDSDIDSFRVELDPILEIPLEDLNYSPLSSGTSKVEIE